MSFWLYKNESMTYRKIAPVKLAGTAGILAAFLKENQEADTPHPWKLTAPDLISKCCPKEDAQNFKLVLDMSSESEKTLCLYQVASIQGNSVEDETDLVLQCHLLFQQAGDFNDTAKDQFELSAPLSTNSILEPLHLTGGTRGGSYRWAKPKMDIGAAIYSKSA